jgi:hypothetical protein
MRRLAVHVAVPVARIHVSPSTLRSTAATPRSSCAVPVNVTLECATVLPFSGDVMERVGGLVSGGTGSGPTTTDFPSVSERPFESRASRMTEYVRTAGNVWVARRFVDHGVSQTPSPSQSHRARSVVPGSEVEVEPSKATSSPTRGSTGANVKRAIGGDGFGGGGGVSTRVVWDSSLLTLLRKASSPSNRARIRWSRPSCRKTNVPLARPSASVSNVPAGHHDIPPSSLPSRTTGRPASGAFVSLCTRTAFTVTGSPGRDGSGASGSRRRDVGTGGGGGGAMTVRTNVAARAIVPSDPSTRTMYVPSGVLGSVESPRSAPQVGVHVAGVKAHDAPTGRASHASATSCGLPLTRVTLTVTLTEPPGATDPDVGSIATAKSKGGGTADTVRRKTADRVTVPLVAATLTA